MLSGLVFEVSLVISLLDGFPSEILIYLAQAILLGGLALKRRWQEKRKAANITEAATPNIVCSSAVHVCACPSWTSAYSVCTKCPVFRKTTLHSAAAAAATALAAFSLGFPVILDIMLLTTASAYNPEPHLSVAGCRCAGRSSSTTLR